LRLTDIIGNRLARFSVIAVDLPQDIDNIVATWRAALFPRIGELDALIQEYYRQMRKFGCNILAVVQQYDIIKDSAVRGAMIGNSKMLSTVGLNEVE
jgi:hypothetical protein